MPKLSARKAETLKAPGMYSDGGGLYLCVAKAGTKSWILRTTVRGRTTASGKPYRVELGIGSYTLVSLAEARQKAIELLRLARDGKTPKDPPDTPDMTFSDCARRVHEGLAPTWRNEKHSASWLRSVEVHAGAAFGDRPMATITRADIHRILSPIWVERHESAKRLSQRLATIFDWAKGAGYYSHENPVTGLKRALPRVRQASGHFAALPWQELPEFMVELAKRDGASARCLTFIILTAARSGEARGVCWSEIDGDTWTVPATRMKRGLVHRVPLSHQAQAVLETMRGLDPKLVFPSPQLRKGKSSQMSDAVFKALFKRMHREGVTVHGFRSSFRDWCGDENKAPREVAETALSHAVGTAVERAYARSDLFDRRRQLMQGWADFVFSLQGADQLQRVATSH